MLSTLLQVHILHGTFFFCISSISCSDESAELEKLWINEAENAAFGEFQYMALLEIRVESYNTTCTGVLICDRFVLTAGYCASSNVSRLQVSFRTEEGRMSKIKAKKWQAHERYIHGVWGHDIGLTELESPATELSGVEIAPLPTTDELPQLETFVIVAGYGYEDFGNFGSPPEYLKKASIKVSNSCNGNKNCLSATVGSGSFCSWDHSAPVVFENKVIAIASELPYHRECQGVSGLFTTIFPYIEWINEKMMNK